MESIVESAHNQPVVLSALAETHAAAQHLQSVTTPVARQGSLVLAQGWTLFALDVILAATGFALGYSVRYVLRIGGLHDVLVAIQPLELVLSGVAVVMLALFELARGGAYRRRLSVGGLDTHASVFRAVTVAMAVVIVASAALQQQSVSRLVYLYIWLAMLVLMCGGRLARSFFLSRAYHRGHGVRRVLVVGATPTGKMVMQNLAARLSSGYRLVGFIGDRSDTPRRFGRFAGLGTVADLSRVLSEHAVDDVIVALPSASHRQIADIFAHCERAGVAVKLVPDLFDLRLSRVRMDGVAGIPLIDVHNEHLGPVALGLKRLLDIMVASIALVVAAPLMAVVALAIRLESPGPMLFRQERLGKNGIPFTILKFRSMRPDAERQLALLREQNEASGPIFKMRRDPRVTRVGRIIRKLSIDELPQLWNVLRGDMSLVGPRPPLASEVEHYEDWHRRRLEAIPGITCLWGVSGRSKLDFDEMVMLDVYYMDNWSLGLDLKILFRTAVTLIRPNGAY